MVEGLPRIIFTFAGEGVDDLLLETFLTLRETLVLQLLISQNMSERAWRRHTLFLQP